MPDGTNGHAATPPVRPVSHIRATKRPRAPKPKRWTVIYRHTCNGKTFRDPIWTVEADTKEQALERAAETGRSMEQVTVEEISC